MKKLFCKIIAFLYIVLGLSFIGCKFDTEEIPVVQENIPYQLSGFVKGKLTLDSSIPYTLKGAYVVKSGGELIIPAGTKITATTTSGQSAYIAVLQGGKIDIQGTDNDPVIMTSDKLDRGDDSSKGDWGGLIICGRATRYSKVDTYIESGLNYKYGGIDDLDNSGSIKYLIIKGSGARVNNRTNYNGLSLCAVGSATILENIAVIGGNDDGIELYGGAAILKNVYLKNNADDSIDWTAGWSGSVENIYIKNTLLGFHTALESDGKNMNPTFTNFTAITDVTGDFNALHFKERSGAIITGLYLKGYVKNFNTVDRYLSQVKVDGLIVDTNKTYLDPYTKLDISSWNWYKK